MSIGERFREMLRRLHAEPGVRVLHAQVADPAPAATLGLVEEALGSPLVPVLRELYADMNGLQLSWIGAEVEDDEEEELRRDLGTGQLDPFFVDRRDRDPTGSIHIVPVEVAFLGRGRDDRWIDEQVCPFDWFSFFGDMSFDRSRSPMPLLLSDGHHDSRHDSSLTDIESYLEFLLFTAGHVEARQSFYQGRTSQNVWLHTPRSFFAARGPARLGPRDFEPVLRPEDAQV